MTGRELYERFQALRLEFGKHADWDALDYRDKDAWDALAATVERDEVVAR